MHVFDIPINYVNTIVERYNVETFIQITLEYGKNAHSNDPFNHKHIDTVNGSNSVFLHPVFRLKFINTTIDEFHIPENIWTIWKFNKPLADTFSYFFVKTRKTMSCKKIMYR